MDTCKNRRFLALRGAIPWAPGSETPGMGGSRCALRWRCRCIVRPSNRFTVLQPRGGSRGCHVVLSHVVVGESRRFGAGAPFPRLCDLSYSEKGEDRLAIMERIGWRSFRRPENAPLFCKGFALPYGQVGMTLGKANPSF